jgi:HTH-type transcriptional regulator, sugar sensing transcriptional regulator
MNRDEWIQKLKRLGLSGYEAQVYIALLGETRAPASRVVRKSGVPQSKVYGALSSLVSRGFAELVLGDVKLYRGIPPQEAFDNYRRSVESTLDAAKADMDNLAQCAPDAPTSDPGNLGIRLIRSHQIRGVLDDAFDKAQFEILMVAKHPLVIPPDIEMDRRATSRGVKLRQIVERAVLDDPVHGGAVLEEEAAVGDIRFLDYVPMRFTVIDRRVTMLALSEEDGATMALVVPNRGLVENMHSFFESMWGQAKEAREFLAGHNSEAEL